MNTTRPRELIYFHFLPAQTVEDGVLITYYAVDDFSKFAFVLGVSKEFTFDSIIKHIQKLMNDKDFKITPRTPFTLMSSCGHEIEDKIASLIKPYKGNVIFDTDLVIKKTEFFVNELERFLDR